MTDHKARFVRWINDQRRLPYVFEIDEHNQELFDLLWAYFFGGDLPEGVSRSKGWLIYGNPGTGKTDLFRVFQWALNPRNNAMKFRKIELWRVAQNYKAKGEEAFSYQSLKPGHWFFDELGMIDRETVAFYGNTENVAERLIHERYVTFKSAGMVTHFTSNLSAQMLQQAYDERTISRLREMCNLYALSGPDRRKTAKVHRIELDHVTDKEDKREQTEKEIAKEISDLATHLQAGNKMPFLNGIQVRSLYDFLDARGLIEVSTEQKRELYLKKKADYLAKLGSNPMFESLTKAKQYRELVSRRGNPLPAKGNGLDWAIISDCKREALREVVIQSDFLEKLEFIIKL